MDIPAPDAPVKAWEETVTIPTYPPAAPEKNPLFWEKRQNQGASGRVYPYPVTEAITTEKQDRPYRAVFLENAYLRLMLLPELGGRIFEGLDKTNGYHFFYRQHVIKPALIGLLGPWISGGVEFNWPLHHRPSTFLPVDYTLEEHPDGSRTVWMGEHEALERTRGMVGVCLRPGKAYLEAKVRLYNRTPFAQSFLWWANVGVHVNDDYQIVFPPDVTCVNDHGKRYMASYPVARGYYGVYFGHDYGDGTDISWAKNFPPPGSCFVNRSEADFFGGYDHARQAGVIYIGDHHISPGKKFFTWGTTAFARAWERNLTDADGPYIELMAGVYTDNQPDFAWMQPYETRSFSQFWYPVQAVGAAKQANLHGALNLEVAGGKAWLGVSVTAAQPAARLRLSANGRPLAERRADLAPGRPLALEVALPDGQPAAGLTLALLDAAGAELLRYTIVEREAPPLPEPATEPPLPHELATNEELYLVGLHLLQYRHATRPPEDYWREALRRDPADSRANTAIGLHWLRCGDFDAAEAHFTAALGRLARWNPNPPDCTAYFYLGVTRQYQGRLALAADAFQKAAWDAAWQPAAHFRLAQLASRGGDFARALLHLDEALANNARHAQARQLKAALLRRLGHPEEALALAAATARDDRLDFGARWEAAQALRVTGRLHEAGVALDELATLLRDSPQTYLDLAFDYGQAGLWDEARELLEMHVAHLPAGAAVYPLVLYAQGYLALQAGDAAAARAGCLAARQQPPDYCFPSRLEELLALQGALELDPDDARAHYYLGNLLYDKQQPQAAIAHWEAARRLEPGFAIPWRNLGIAYFNQREDAAGALDCYREALRRAPGEARLLLELDDLLQRTGASPAERLALLEAHAGLVAQRDDLYLEQIKLLTALGRPAEALERLRAHQFHPWEGSEGAVTAQYVAANLSLSQALLQAGQPPAAQAACLAALAPPENLGEGLHRPVHAAAIHYHLGLAQAALGETQAARASLERAAAAGAAGMPAAYWAARALQALGRPDEAAARLGELLASAQAAQRVEVRTSFQTSSASVFYREGDFERQQRAEAAYLAGLAYSGLGEAQQAQAAFSQALALEPGHFGVLWIAG